MQCRPGLRLPRVLQSGVSESELKGVAVDLTAVINKILGKRPHSSRLPGAAIMLENAVSSQAYPAGTPSRKLIQMHQQAVLHHA